MEWFCLFFVQSFVNSFICLFICSFIDDTVPQLPPPLPTIATGNCLHHLNCFPLPNSPKATTKLTTHPQVIEQWSDDKLVSKHQCVFKHSEVNHQFVFHLQNCHSCAHSCAHSFVHLFIQSFIHSFVCLFIHPFTHLFIHLMNGLVHE